MVMKVKLSILGAKTY